jgi:recombinational DNA repair protein RecR
MWELKKELENRKENLIYTLKNKKDIIELEKQHQMYGAIKELDHVLKLMNNYREEEALGKLSQMLDNSEATESESNVIQKVGEKVRTFKSPIRIRFAKNDA